MFNLAFVRFPTTAPNHIYFFITQRPPSSTLSLHDALPIYVSGSGVVLEQGDSALVFLPTSPVHPLQLHAGADRKSTRLNSSHSQISYAVCCLKKTSAFRFSSSFE